MSVFDPKSPEHYIERLQGALLVGLAWDTAIVALNIPLDVADVLEKDPRITEFRARATAEMEYELLKLHQTARKVAAGKGQARPIEWMLGQINPAKYAPIGNNAPKNPTLVEDDI